MQTYMNKRTSIRQCLGVVAPNDSGNQNQTTLQG